MDRLINSWERRPVLLSRGPRLGVDARVIFRLLLRYSDRCRRMKRAPGLKLFLDGRGQYTAEVLKNLPTRSDKTLVGYHKRMEQSFGDYCLICDELMAVAVKERQTLERYVKRLHRRVGGRFHFAEVGLYLGNYRTTPFGVHVDGCGVLSFPIVGQKKFRVWNDQYVRRHPKLQRTHNYKVFLKASRRLRASPGQAVYWPSSAWHIAESSETFSATWSLGFWQKPRQGRRRASWLFP